MKLVVGLGNPGKEYENTRHNVGFWLVDFLAESQKTDWKNEKSRQAATAKIKIGGQDVLLTKPQTFMNESGRAVLALVQFYKIDPKDVLIVQDDMDLPEKTFKFYLGGRAAGHHGIESIQETLPDLEFMRLRIGIGRPELPMEGADWVLLKVSPQERGAYRILFEKEILPKIQEWLEKPRS